MFSPLLFGLTLYYVSSLKSKIYKYALISILCLTSVSFVRTVLLFPFFLKEGVSLEGTQQNFAEIKKGNEGGDVLYGVSDSLWPLTSDYSKMTRCQFFGRYCRENRERLTLLWQQSGTGWLAPPSELHGMKLIRHNFNPKAPRILGIKIANTIPGYNFAVYKSESAQEANHPESF